MDHDGIEAGGYVLLSISGTCCLAGLDENAEGRLCATSALVDVPMVDLCLFMPTGLRVEIAV